MNPAASGATNPQLESLKFLADRLAHRVATDDGLRTTRLLGAIPPLESPPPPVAEPAGGDGHHVGIWRRQRRNGRTVFARDSEMRREWHLWADVDQIGPKEKRYRIALLGESVARGFHFGTYTPGMVLEKVLESELGDVEVVDLARSAIGLEIRDVALAAVALEPDAVVMFCGNNWRYRPGTDPADSAHLSAAVGERGLLGYKEHAERTLRGRIGQVIDEICSCYAERGIPLLWIIPEFNLGDWRDPVTGAPHLPQDHNRRWASAEETARTALASGDFAAAAAAARRMLDLDHGTSAAGYYVLAECGRGAGDPEATRAALESARDACAWDTAITHVPRSTATIRDALRARAGDIVDSPELFRDHLGGRVPDRRLFVDYCHLSSEGIRVTMAAAAAKLLRTLKKRDVAWRDLLARAPAPAAEVESEAHFLAAIHSAHWWQSYERVERGIARAVRLSRHIVPMMTAFLDIQARRTPAMMCRSAEEISKSGSPQIQKYLFGYNWQQLDALLTAAIVNSLEDDDLRGRIDRLRTAEHSAGRHEVDLLEYYYNSSAHQPYEVEWAKPGLAPPDRDYYKAFSRRSKFVFVGERGRPVRLDLTCRVPHPSRPEETVEVWLNDERASHLTCDADWGTHEITLPEGLVRDGLNQLTISWPLPCFPAEEALEKMADDLLAGEVPDPYCSFGDIHTFTASPVPGK